MIVVVFAHPYPHMSRANRALLAAIEGLDGIAVRSLYDRYPDFAVDAAAEREALEGASTIVWQHPIFWYTVPALLKLWFEKVLIEGWAWGKDGDVLRGKRCLWAITTGGTERDYATEGLHQHTFAAFAPVVRQTAQFCGMEWLEPFVVPGAQMLDDAALAAWGERYRSRLTTLMEESDG